MAISIYSYNEVLDIFVITNVFNYSFKGICTIKYDSFDNELLHNAIVNQKINYFYRLKQIIDHIFIVILEKT